MPQNPSGVSDGSSFPPFKQGKMAIRFPEVRTAVVRSVCVLDGINTVPGWCLINLSSEKWCENPDGLWICAGEVHKKSALPGSSWKGCGISASITCLLNHDFIQEAVAAFHILDVVDAWCIVLQIKFKREIISIDRMVPNFLAKCIDQADRAFILL